MRELHSVQRVPQGSRLQLGELNSRLGRVRTARAEFVGFIDVNCKVERPRSNFCLIYATRLLHFLTFGNVPLIQTGAVRRVVVE